VRHFPYFFLIN